MRFTKFLAATMAAMTIASCSEQVTDFGQEIQPGDAVLSFKVGTGGGTTYASEADETKVNTLQAFLAYTNGTGQAAFMPVTTTANSIDETLSDGDFTPGEAKLYFIANLAIDANTVQTEEELLKLADKKEIYTNDNGVLKLDPTGMTSTRMVTIDLQSGTVNTGKLDGTVDIVKEVPLKRLAARVYASSSNEATPEVIKGYKIDFLAITGQANLFTYKGDGSGVQPAQYEITGDGTNQYKNSEAVGYIYPSDKDVTITVTHPKKPSEMRTVVFKPVANKNYKVVITPNDGANLNFSVKLEEFEVGDTGEADFTASVFNENFSNGAGVKYEKGMLEVTSSETNVHKLVIKDLIKSHNLDDVAYSYIANISRISKANGSLEVKDQGSHIELTVPYNYSTQDIQAALKVHIMKLGGTKQDTVVTYTLPVVVKNKVLPEGFLVDMGTGETFMAINSRQTGNIDEDIEAFNKIVSTASGSTVSEKMIAYLKKSVEQFQELAGPYKSTKDTKCPGGFKMPSQVDYKKLLGNTFNYSSVTNSFTENNPTQYNVRKRNVMETIKNATEGEVTQDYTVGIFDSDLTVAGRQSYRVIKYKAQALVLTSIASSGNFGGLRTVEPGNIDANIGLNNGNTSSTMYTHGVGDGLLQVRCIKDVTANAEW